VEKGVVYTKIPPTLPKPTQSINGGTTVLINYREKNKNKNTPLHIKNKSLILLLRWTTHSPKINSSLNNNNKIYKKITSHKETSRKVTNIRRVIISNILSNGTMVLNLHINTIVMILTKPVEIMEG
jgi:hypothetical protein